MSSSSDIKAGKNHIFKKYFKCRSPQKLYSFSTQRLWCHIRTLGLKLYQGYKIRTKIILGFQSEIGLNIIKYDRDGFYITIGFRLQGGTKNFKNVLQSVMELQNATDYKAIQYSTCIVFLEASEI